MNQKVFRQMIRMPMAWFQARRIADILSRMQSADAVRTFISNALGVVLDGLLSLVTLACLALAAPKLALVAVGGFAAYVLLRLASIPVTMALNRRAILAGVAEQAKRMETLRAIQTVKVLAAEAGREADWSAKLAESIRAIQANAAATTYFGAVQGLVKTLVTILAVFVGAQEALSGAMSVGMLVAALAYLGQFTARAGSLFEQFATWRTLEVHLERLSDVMLEPREPGIERADKGSDRVTGAVRLANVSFGIGPQDPLILDRLDLEVAPGEHVAITGASGVGKSTLLKIIAGLHLPLTGEVLIDGKPFDHWGPRTAGSHRRRPAG